jgi:hypothetical protein
MQSLYGKPAVSHLSPGSSVICGTTGMVVKFLTRRAGGAHANVAYFCKLPEAPQDAMLVEIPKREILCDTGHLLATTARNLATMPFLK